MKFLDAKNNGMSSTVKKHVQGKELEMLHSGWIREGKISPEDFSGSGVHYFLEEKDGGTNLIITVHTKEDFEKFNQDYYPKILDSIKEIAETADQLKVEDKLETLNFEIHINAPAARIWELLWSATTYPQWTQFFTNRKVMRSDWQLHGKTYFLDGDGAGLVSTIESLEIPVQVVFRHLGLYKDGIEDTQSFGVKEWSGMEEKYFLRETAEGFTELRAITHCFYSEGEAVRNGFTKGFDLVKQLAEATR